MLSAHQLISTLQWRYATKQFAPAKKISDNDWSALEDSLVLSPSSFGLQPWKFLVIQNPEVRQQLLPHSWNQTQVVDASHFVVFAAQDALDNSDVDRLLDSTAQTRGIPVESLQGYGGMIKQTLATPGIEILPWNTRQVYIALGFFMLSAATLEIDTCPMEGISPANYDDILGLTGSGFSTVVACAAGYRAAEDKYAALAKVRYAKDDLIQVV